MTTLGRREKVSAEALRKGVIYGRWVRRTRNRPLPTPPGSIADQNRLNACWKRPFGLHDELEPEGQNGNSGLRILANVHHIVLGLAKDGQKNSIPRVKILRIARRFREATCDGIRGYRNQKRRRGDMADT